MDVLKRFLTTTFNVGVAALALGALLVTVALWGVGQYQESWKKRAEASLAEKKLWPDQGLEPLGTAQARLATMWRGGLVYLRFDIDGYPPAVDAAQDSENPQFVLTFEDKAGFKLFEHRVPLAEMTRRMGNDGKFAGLTWSGQASKSVSAEDYRSFSRLSIGWAGFPEESNGTLPKATSGPGSL